MNVSPFECLALAGKLFHAVAAGGQLGLLNDQHGEAVLDLEPRSAALAHELVALKAEARAARVHRAAENLQQFRTDHETRPSGGPRRRGSGGRLGLAKIRTARIIRPPRDRRQSGSSPARPTKRPGGLRHRAPERIPAITYSRAIWHYHRPWMLNGRVRNGNGCDHPGMLTEKIPCLAGKVFLPAKVYINW
jgi:hypothetical protein